MPARIHCHSIDRLVRFLVKFEVREGDLDELARRGLDPLDEVRVQGKITGISYCRDGFWLRDNLGVWCKANIVIRCNKGFTVAPRRSFRTHAVAVLPQETVVLAGVARYPARAEKLGRAAVHGVGQELVHVREAGALTHDVLVPRVYAHDGVQPVLGEALPAVVHVRLVVIRHTIGVVHLEVKVAQRRRPNIMREDTDVGIPV